MFFMKARKIKKLKERIETLETVNKNLKRIAEDATALTGEATEAWEELSGAFDDASSALVEVDKEFERAEEWDEDEGGKYDYTKLSALEDTAADAIAEALERFGFVRGELTDAARVAFIMATMPNVKTGDIEEVRAAAKSVYSAANVIWARTKGDRGAEWYH